MVRLQQPNECSHLNCPGSVYTSKDPQGNVLFGGMLCLCYCHDKQKAEKVSWSMIDVGTSDYINDSEEW